MIETCSESRFLELRELHIQICDLEIPFYVYYYLPREDRGFSPQHLHIAVLLTGTVAFRNQFYVIVVLFKPFSTVQW